MTNIISHQFFSFQSDVYSFGITIIEMCENSIPYRDWERPKKFSEEVREIAALCMQKTPSKRPDVYKLKEHPFVKKAKGPKPLKEVLAEHKKKPEKVT